MTLNKKDVDRYDASSIQVLEGLEGVRRRPGMYIGSTGPRGLHHLVWEIVDNSIDEALAGYCDTIIVEIFGDNFIKVVDNGREADRHSSQNRLSTVETIFTVLHAGESSTERTINIRGCTVSVLPLLTP